MTTPKQSHKNKASNPGGENVSDIQSLTLHVQALSQSLDWWNAAIVVTLAVAALVAIAAGVTTGIAFSKSKRLNEAQAELAHAKEGQLALDLIDKDDKIAEANLARARIEERIAWRTIVESQRNRIKEVLGRFKGQAFDIDGSNVDPELDSFSSDIRSALVAAGWVPRDIGRWGSTAGYKGIRILVNSKTKEVPAAVALVDLLKSPDFSFKEVAMGFDVDEANKQAVPWSPVKPGAVAIHPGRKP